MTQTAQQQAEQAASWLGCDASELVNPFELAAVTSSKEWRGQKIIIYGVPGIGKTTFAGTFPKPILLRTEDGAAALDIPTFPARVTRMSDFNEVFKALNGKHDFKTLIIDSLDWLEPLVFQSVIDEHNREKPSDLKNSIEAFGYGKGYVKAKELWQRFFTKLDKLQERGMSIVAIAHAAAVIFEAPDADPYQRYSLKMNKHSAALWMEWADMILFLNYKTSVIKGESGKLKGKGHGERVIFTQERPAYQAKSRWPLDEEIFIGNDPAWAAFHENLKEATGGLYRHG